MIRDLRAPVIDRRYSESPRVLYSLVPRNGFMPFADRKSYICSAYQYFLIPDYGRG